jgi:hypothetical protein
VAEAEEAGDQLGRVGLHPSRARVTPPSQLTPSC